MSAFRSSIGQCVVAGMTISAAGWMASTAMADSTGSQPNFLMAWDVSGDNLPTNTYNPATFGTVNFGTWTVGGNGGDGPLRERTGWRYQGGLDHTLWSLTWDCIVDPDPFVDAVINVTNNSTNTETFTLFMPLGIAPSIPGSTVMSGWVSAVVSDNNFNGAIFGAADTPVYRAYIDGTNVLSTNMWNPGFTLVAGMLGSNNANDSFTNLIGPPAMTEIGIALRFVLSPGDSASVTGIFEVVPGPGGVALLSLAGLFACRRRRMA